MKKNTAILVIIAFLGVLRFDVFSQTTEKKESAATFVGTVGFLQGGGSLVGFDLELVTKSGFGMQAGVGFKGYGFGINVHPKGVPNSSFGTIQFWHQGFGEFTSQTAIGPAYVWRGKKFLTAQLGLGYVLYRRADLFKNRNMKDQSNFMLTYALGVYFPLKTQKIPAYN